MEQIDTTIQHDGSGALVGFIYSFVCLIVAEFSVVLHEHVPALIMDLFQVGAWGMTICLGAATIYFKFLKKKK